MYTYGRAPPPTAVHAFVASDANNNNRPAPATATPTATPRRYEGQYNNMPPAHPPVAAVAMAGQYVVHPSVTAVATTATGQNPYAFTEGEVQGGVYVNFPQTVPVQYQQVPVRASWGQQFGGYAPTGYSSAPTVPVQAVQVVQVVQPEATAAQESDEAAQRVRGVSRALTRQRGVLQARLALLQKVRRRVENSANYIPFPLADEEDVRGVVTVAAAVLAGVVGDILKVAAAAAAEAAATATAAAAAEAAPTMPSIPLVSPPTLPISAPPLPKAGTEGETEKENVEEKVKMEIEEREVQEQKAEDEESKKETKVEKGGGEAIQPPAREAASAPGFDVRTDPFTGMDISTRFESHILKVVGNGLGKADVDRMQKYALKHQQHFYWIHEAWKNALLRAGQPEARRSVLYLYAAFTGLSEYASRRVRAVWEQNLSQLLEWYVFYFKEPDGLRFFVFLLILGHSSCRHLNGCNEEEVAKVMKILSSWKTHNLVSPPELEKAYTAANHAAALLCDVGEDAPTARRKVYIPFVSCLLCSNRVRFRGPIGP